jgi:dTDP-glucose 4,6-dehydratase
MFSAIMGRMLITGAAGFLGSHLCDALLEQGHSVIGMDNLVSGRPDNLESIFYDEDFEFFQHDVTEYIHVTGELDTVIHLASLASPVFYREHPIKTLKVGAQGTHKTLGLAKEKAASYMFASTSEVYGDPEVHPQPESYRGNVDSFGPRSCYDESKRFAESLIRSYRDQHGIDVRVARIFNTYGSRMRLDDGRVIPNFMKQAIRGDDLTVFGDGSQTRSFCHVDDLVSGLLALKDSDVDTPVNLGNPDERTILELAEVITELTGSDSNISYEPLPPQDPETRRPDISKANELIDWSPTVSLSEGLERVIPYFRHQVQTQ